MKFYQSEELVGTSQEQKLFHNLGKMPQLVLVHPVTTSFAPYTVDREPIQYVCQGIVESVNGLRKRDMWPVIITSEYIVVKVIAGKKFKVTAFA